MFVSFLIFLALLVGSLSRVYSKKEPISKIEHDCLGCHEEIKLLKEGTRHDPLPCSRCHSKLEDHLKDLNKRPETHLEISICGKCHPLQYETFLQVHLKSKAKVEKSTTTGRSPNFDRLLNPHGFIKEHNEPDPTGSCSLII